MKLRKLFLIKQKFKMLTVAILFMVFQLPNAGSAESHMVNDVQLEEAFYQIGQKYRVFFNYDRAIASNIRVEYHDDQHTTLEESLSFVLKNTNLNYKIFDQRYVVVYQNDEGGLASLKKMINHFQGIVDEKELIRSRKTELLQPLYALSSLELNRRRVVNNISGIVTDQSGQPLIGVNVLVKGENHGTATDFSGVYNLEDVNENAILVFSYIGYQSQEVALNGRTNINVTLIEDSQTLDEVVVVGYGTQKKSDLTGSVASVKGDKLNSFPTTNIAQSLQGRVSGVHVTQASGQPGDNLQVRIRGTNSINGGSDPMWIIDGFPSNPNIINTDDIKSIEILKDASATAIYGSRGANGVIIVTTKNGIAGRTRVEYNGSISSQSIIKKLPLMNASEYMEFTNIQQLNDGGQKYFSDSDIANISKEYDWQDIMFKSALMHKHGINVSGGNEKTQFVVSGSYFDQGGILIENSNFRRISLRSNINHKISDFVDLSYGVILNRIDNNQKGSENTEYGIYGQFNDILTAPPTLSPFEEDGSYSLLKTAYPFLADGQSNPLMWAKEVENHILENNILGNLAITIKPITDLSIKISGNVFNSNMRQDKYTPTTYITSPGEASVNTSQTVNFNSYNIATYDKAMGMHNLKVTGGITYEESTSTNIGASGAGFISDVYETYNIGAASTIRTPFTNYIKWNLLSYLGRVNYVFDNRYLATVSYRADGSSRYSAGNKWGYFPSAALAWRISNEKFMDGLRKISDLKLRVGYGETGSTAINPYTTLRNLSSGQTVFNKELYTYFAPSSTYPGDLKWETTSQADIGLDIGLMNNRFSITTDFYYKKTKDLLNNVQLPRSAGYSTTVRNIGEMENKGFEFQIDGLVIDKVIKWNLSTNISVNRNKVLKLYNGQDIFGASLGNAGNVNVVTEGESISLFYGYVETGYDENGTVTYKDINGDDLINDNDREVIGNPMPKFIYSLNSELIYKNFELSFFLQGSQGNDIYSQSLYFLNSYYGYGTNMFQEVLNDHWSPENPNAKYPLISQSNYTAQKLSDRFVYDGSYLRLRSLKLTYSIPFQKMNINGISSGQLYVSGQNLLTVSAYPWYDPDVNNFGGGNSINQGIDAFSYPSNKSYTVGIKFEF